MTGPGGNGTMDKRKLTGKYVLIYTALFVLLCVLVFSPFVRSGRCLVGNGDGQSQYILQLEYMGRWLREALDGFLHGDFTPARFDFSIGMGDDIISVVRFHPLDFLSVFVTESGIEILYQVLIFLRLYLAGLTFSLFAFAWKRMSGKAEGSDTQAHEGWAVLAGSMVYLFTGYTFCLGIVHPTYLSPLITLPLLLLGAERMMHREEEHRFVLFTVMTAVSFISNYYFMYIASVAAVLYVFVRFFQIYKENRIRQFAVLFLRFAAAYATGLLIACITLLPTLKRYGSSYRSQHLTSLKNLLFYADRRRYAAWLINLISPLRASGNGTHLNYAVLVLPAILLLFFVRKEAGERGKERTFLRIASLVLLAFLLIPAGGFLLAAMNNENNRWVFLIALLCGGIVSFAFTDFFRMEKRLRIVLIVGCVLYDLAVAAAAALMGYDPYQAAGAVQLTVTTILLVLIGNRAGRKTVSTFLVCVCLVSCAVDGIMTFGRPFGNLTRYYRKAGNSISWYRNSVYANYLRIPEDGNEGFYRVDGVFPGNKEDNAALLLGYRGIQMYNSVMNPSEIDALMDTGNVGLTTMLHIRYLDGRSAAEELAGVRYFMAAPATMAALPYGYAGEPVCSDGKTAIYENRFPLSLSYGCRRVMPEREYEKLTQAEREYVCLDAAVVADDAVHDFSGEILTAEAFRAGMQIETVPVSGTPADEGLREETAPDGGRTLKVTGKDAGYRIPVPMKAGYACCLSLEGVSSSAAAKIFVEARDVSDRVSLLTQDATYTLQRSDYLVNLGTAQEDGTKEVTMRFPEKGTYQMDHLDLVYIPLAGYEDKVLELRSHALEEETVGEDEISGRARWDEDGIQVFSIPYSEGWSAEVDGQKAELLKTDRCWMGLRLSKGSHEIRLIYHTPMQGAGMLCCAAGLLLLILGALFFRRKNRAGQTRHN